MLTSLSAKLVGVVAVACASLLAVPSDACTAIGVGRRASDDGSVMVAHTDDSGGMGDNRLVRVPARSYPEGAMRPVYLSVADHPRMIAPERADGYAPKDAQQANLSWATPIGYVPQVGHTFAYWDVDYGLGNEHGLVMGETTCSGRWNAAPIGLPNGTALFGIEELSKIALERCKTARCAVSTMGALAEEYGYYGGNGHLGGMQPWPGTLADEEGEAMVVGDAEGELWVFHVLPGPNGGAVWAAQRMPEDTVVVVANMFVIREMNLTDSSTFLASKGIEELAASLQLCKGAFDFTEAFSGDFKARTRFDELIDAFYTGRRVWRIFDLLAPSLRLDPDLGVSQARRLYPLGVVPEAPLGVDGLLAILRDHFEGTDYDLTKGPGAGPYGTPNRWDGRGGEREVNTGAWERGISIHRTIFSFVAQARPSQPQELKGRVWFGEDTPHATCYWPFWLSQTSLPAAYTEGSQAVFDMHKNAWWASNAVKRVMDLNYDRAAPIVAGAQAECERAGREAAESAEQQARATLAAVGASGPSALLPSAVAYASAGEASAAASRVLEAASHANAKAAHARWVRLFGELMVRFKNGYENSVLLPGSTVHEDNIGYPAWWLREVGYGGWQEWVDARQQRALAAFEKAGQRVDAFPQTPERGAGDAALPSLRAARGASERPAAPWWRPGADPARAGRAAQGSVGLLAVAACSASSFALGALATWLLVVRAGARRSAGPSRAAPWRGQRWPSSVEAALLAPDEAAQLERAAQQPAVAPS